jgi:acetyl-CoA C-acetyltransferase
MMADPERIPVIIAGGQINDRPDVPTEGMDSLELMVAALRAADMDGGCGLLADLDSLAIVDQISFRGLGNLCAPLAAAIGANPAINYQSDAPHGDTPIRLLNEAANRIGAGEIRLAAVVGAEALRTAGARAAKATNGKAENAMRALAKGREPGYVQLHGLSTPVDVYPLYENAGRAAYGQTLAEGQAESGLIWSQFSDVAADNEAAWMRKPVSAEEVITPSEKNRPIAFPYNKFMVANSAVNQGAAFIIASLAEARRRGVAEARMIYIGMGAAAKEDSHFLKRDRFDRSNSMDVSIRRTLKLNGLSVADIDLVELYSCFPCVPKMARRTLGWPAERPATVFGGLTFGGGPIANYMSHAVICMAERLRSGRLEGGQGQTGFLFANGGFATDNHCIILSSAPIAAAAFPKDFDYQAEADATRDPIPPLDKDYVGAATVETYTVFYDRAGQAKSGVVVARTPQGARTLAHIDATNADMIALFTSGVIEPVGMSGTISTADPEGRRFWCYGSVECEISRLR